jgi:hypothetical protein
MKLKDYAQDAGLYFTPADRTVFYYTDTGATKESVGARNWESGELEWLDPEMEIRPYDLPPRPMPPDESWMVCRDTTPSEMRRVFRKYIRQVEAYADAVTNAALAEAEKGPRARIQERIASIESNPLYVSAEYRAAQTPEEQRAVLHAKASILRWVLDLL